jgi:hypothetical protein
MRLIERFKRLPGPMIVLHIFSKVLIGFGLGVVLAQYIPGAGVWCVVAGVILSIPPIYMIFK